MVQTQTQQNLQTLDFNNTEIAFKAKSDADLRNSLILFWAIGFNWLVQIGPGLVNFCFKIGLPIKGIIKSTVFKQFCGGESIDDCENSINQLHKFKVGTILDYSVEGEEKESVFNQTAEEILKTISKAHNNLQIPFSVFKVTGVAKFALLEKINQKINLSDKELTEFNAVKIRINRICQHAYNLNVKLFIDAEESWIQDAIDDLADEMMEKYNKEKAIVYNTIQFYRHDRLAFLHRSFNNALEKNYFLGIKLVRGAYMEKERLRAKQLGYIDPIQTNKEASDNDYNAGLDFCIKNINKISICAGTHNEDSSRYLAELMLENNISATDERIYFSQLYGMSDNLSFNLADANYNVAKYLPYGPVKSVLPYLFRRAQENTSVQGQAGRELNLIAKERNRRKGVK